jgi:ribose transport system substrate-binding protein
MKKLKFLISLTNGDNDYQQEQARAAEAAALRLDVSVKVIHAGNDPLMQSQQLLQFVQGDSSSRPDAIVFEPAGGTAFPQIARAAAAAGIGWAVLNHDVDYLAELRRTSPAPMFSISTDHQEVGRIQGSQFAALLPNGGCVLYIEGPANSAAARDRTAGMNQAKPANIQVKSLRANWTEESAQRCVSSWLRLSTSQKTQIDLVGAQDDSMAAGARKAFAEIEGDQRARWLKIPLTGCDGMPKTGQAWLRSGILAATIYIPPNTDLALEMLAAAIRTGTQPPSARPRSPSHCPPSRTCRPGAPRPAPVLAAPGFDVANLL